MSTHSSSVQPGVPEPDRDKDYGRDMLTQPD